MKIDEEKLADEFLMLLHLPVWDLKMILFHKVKELKIHFKEELVEYYGFTDIEEPTEGVKKAKSRNYPFELRKSKDRWTVSIPDMDRRQASSLVPGTVVNHILQQKVEPGMAYMTTIEIDGKLLQVSFEKNDNDYYTGSITKKESEIEPFSHQDPEEEMCDDSITLPTGTVEKPEVFKTMLSYLLKHEHFYNYILNEFSNKWKPILDMRRLNKAS